jgi:hypothetical protein
MGGRARNKKQGHVPLLEDKKVGSQKLSYAVGVRA